MKKGVFITLYGVNNIGKSTHAKLLVEHLKQTGYDAVYLKYPIYDLEPTGPALNRILRQENAQSISEEQLQKLFAQNRKDYEPTLKNLLDQGKIVIVEDYTGTGIAWGMAKGLSRKSLEELNKNLVQEDKTLLLAGKRNVAVKEAKHLHEQNEELLDRVSKIFVQLGKLYHWKTVETQPTIEATFQLILKEIMPL